MASSTDTSCPQILPYLTHSFPSPSSEQCRSEKEDILLMISDKPAFSLNDAFETISFGDSPALYISFHVH